MRSRLQIGLIVLAFLCQACQKRIQPAAAPAPAKAPPSQVTQLEQAEAYFRSRDYARAKQSYESILQAEPAGENRDVALFRLALIASRQDERAEANALWRRFVADFPQSSLRSEAELVLALQARVEELERELALRDELSRMSQASRAESAPPPLLPRTAGEARGGKTNGNNSEEELRRLTNERDQLRLQVRRLTDELNALKKIDLERRPSRLPK